MSTDLAVLVRSQILFLTPFLNSLLVYFVFLQDSQDELWGTLLKCAPIIFLVLYIYLKGFDLTERYHCSQRILLGLLFSCVGDALLNLDLFPHGMAAFAVTQVCYISAFGWRPLNLAIGLPLYVAGAIVVAVLFQRLDGMLIVGVPVYVALLLTMCWRALSLGAGKNNLLSTFCTAGSVLFVVSDGLIAVNMFLMEIPHAKIFIMATYYTAQFSIALSTAMECKAPKLSPKRSKLSVQNRIKGSEAGRRRVATKE